MSEKSKRAAPGKRKLKKPTLSACMIVKNEEEMLPRCLESIRGVVDEIIVVDTGSSDRTVEIAKSFGAKVFHHPWENDFSKHRNQSISHARGEWIFVIDADEELVAEDIPKLRRAVQDPSIDAIMVQVISKLRGGRSEGVHFVERILRNRRGIHYEGRVHNRLVGILDAKILPVRILHHGYDLDPKASKEKFERTVSLLMLDLEEDPGDPMPHHYLGCSYLSQGMFRECIEVSTKAIELAGCKNDPNLIYLWSHYNAAISCYRLNDPVKAEAFCQAALGKYPNHVDSRFVLTLIHFDQQRWDTVISHGNEYLRLVELHEREPGAFGNLVMNSLKERWNIGALVGMAHVALGNERNGEEAFNKATQWAPEPFLVARAAGIFFYNRGLLNKAGAYLEKSEEAHGGDETAQRLLEEIRAKTSESGKVPTITCCMIVKNEEAFLEQCLKSVKDYVDEIVIVDTGSTDGTLEIAKKYTDKVHFHLWEGDFSKARNQSLSYASGDWIFIIDGDEELVQGSGERLRETVRNAGNSDAFHVNTISTYGNGAKRARHNSERLFMNNGVIRYEGIVHNRVVGARAVKVSRIEVMHYGYDVEEKRAFEKFLRTTGLLKKQIEEEPDNPMPHHYLGVSYLSRGMNQEAAMESVTAIHLAGDKGDEHPIYIWARHIAAMAHFRMGDLERAKDYSLDALSKYPDHLDSHFMLTMVAGERSEWREVLSHGKRYLELRETYENNPEKAGLVINSAMNEGPTVHLLIGHARHANGSFSKMEEQYRMAAELSEEKWQAWWNAGCFHLDRTGELDRAERYLKAALQKAPEEQQVWYMLAKLCSKKGLGQEEKRCLEKLAELGSEDSVVFNKLGRIYQEEGNLEHAVNCFKKALESYPQGPEPWIHLGEISLEVGQLSEARSFFEQVLTLRPNEIGALLCLSEIELRESSFIEFVNTCDTILKVLELKRNRTIESLVDMEDVLDDIHKAVQHSSGLEIRAGAVVALLRAKLQLFADTLKTARDRSSLDHGAFTV